MNIDRKNIFGPKDVKKAMKVLDDCIPEMIGMQRVIIGDSYNELLDAILDYYSSNQDFHYSARRLCRVRPEDGSPYETAQNTEDYFRSHPNPGIGYSSWIYVIPEYLGGGLKFDLNRVYTAEEAEKLSIGDRCIFGDSIDELSNKLADIEYVGDCDLITKIDVETEYPFHRSPCNSYSMVYLLERACDREFLEEYKAYEKDFHPFAEEQSKTKVEVKVTASSSQKVTVTINGKEVTFDSIEEARAILRDA